MAIEDLARLSERGIYEIQTWLKGLKALPPAGPSLPSFFTFMGFTTVPDSVEDVRARFKELAKQMHPDSGGNVEDFRNLHDQAEKAIKYLEGRW